MNASFENSGRSRERAILLSLIVLLHVGGLWALTAGSSSSSAHKPEKIVSAFMVQAAPAAPAVVESPPTPPQPVPEPPKPQPKPKPKPTPTPEPKPNPTPKPLPRPDPEPPSQPAVTAPAEQPVTTPPPGATAAPAAPSTGEAPVTAAPAPAAPRTITSGVEYVNAPAPRYPSLSRRMGEEGKVVLRILIDDRGRAERIELHESSGSARLDQAAREAVQRARFKPYIENGRAIAVFAIVPIAFKLEN